MYGGVPHQKPLRACAAFAIGIFILLTLTGTSASVQRVEAAIQDVVCDVPSELAHFVEIDVAGCLSEL